MHPPFMFGFFKQEVVGALRNLSFNYINCGEALTTIGWVEALVSSYRLNGMLGFPLKQPIGTCCVHYTKLDVQMYVVDMDICALHLK